MHSVSTKMLVRALWLDLACIWMHLCTTDGGTFVEHLWNIFYPLTDSSPPVVEQVRHEHRDHDRRSGPGTPASVRDADVPLAPTALQSLEPSHEVGRVKVERPSEPSNVVEANVPTSPFKGTYVASIYSTCFCQLLLRKLQLTTTSSHSIPECLLKRRRALSRAPHHPTLGC